MYAIISYKGRQHRIEPEMLLDVDRVAAEPETAQHAANLLVIDIRLGGLADDLKDG